MKICDVAQFYSPISGGVKRYVHDKERFLSGRAGVQHVVIVPSAGDFCRETGGARIHGIKSIALPGSQSYRCLLARRRIEDIIEDERPDVIETGDPYWAAWCALHAGERLGIPVIAFYHSDFPRALGHSLPRSVGVPIETLLSASATRYLAGLYRRMDATVVATRRFQDVLTEAGIPNVVRIPLGTDTERFTIRDSRRKVRAELDIPDDAMLLLYVGRLSREKNIPVLLDMMDWLGSASGFHLLLIGDGEIRRSVTDRVRKCNTVSWLPYCEDTSVLAEYYSGADLLVHAGTAETFGLVSIEAQACGTRVLGIKGGGIDETLTGEVPLIMADDASPAAMARAVLKIRECQSYETPECRQRRRERIVSAFSSTRTFEALMDLYGSVCSRRNGTAADRPSAVEISDDVYRAQLSPV